MNYLHRSVLVFVVLILLCGTLSAQTNAYEEQLAGIQNIDVKFLDYYHPPTKNNRMMMYCRVPFSRIQFVKDGQGFKGAYDLSIEILQDGHITHSELIEKSEYCRDYDKTISKTQFSSVRKNFYLEPNKYKVRLEIEDAETRNSHHMEFDIDLKDFKESKVQISDLLFLSDVNDENIDIIDDIEEERDHVEKVIVFAEIYNLKQGEEYELKYNLQNSKRKKLIKHSSSHISDGVIDSVYLNLDMAEITAGLYEFGIEVKGKDSKEKVSAPMTVSWKGLPVSEVDLDEAIQQLKYIDRENSFKKVKKKSFEEKMNFFKEFWDKRDPTPGTPVNENLEEYYSRVRYANKVFKGRRKGWQTDFGMVYILIGPPNEAVNVPPSPLYRSMKYWYYYERNLTLQFVDDTGTNFYKLKNLSDFYKYGNFDFK